MTNDKNLKLKTYRFPLSTQRGNAFFFVLLGIALFAALAITVSRGMRGNTTARLTDKEINLAVSDIMTYMQRVERAVDRVRRNGCSENDISFENGIVTGYDHAPAAPAKCRVFDASGGLVSWAVSPVNGAHYEFWSGNAVEDIGSGENDLVMTLSIPGEDAICAAFNERIEMSGIASGSNNEHKTLFTGDFGAPAATLDENPGKGAACINANGAGNYLIYRVLLAR